jgi:hypothetical protein
MRALARFFIFGAYSFPKFTNAPSWNLRPDFPGRAWLEERLNLWKRGELPLESPA